MAGVSAFTLLGIAFVILKLLHKITWSWWWVTAPFWGAAAFAVGVFVIFLLVLAGRHAVRRRRYPL